MGQGHKHVKDGAKGRTPNRFVPLLQIRQGSHHQGHNRRHVDPHCTVKMSVKLASVLTANLSPLYGPSPFTNTMLVPLPSLCDQHIRIQTPGQQITLHCNGLGLVCIL
mmetsp:Transcript_125206/g.216992  ORF Transcript_125206/g.216992 Transcript_125206/m.216992 type:complete len:108 (+) Transcript_125206:1314-1637(+)